MENNERTVPAIITNHGKDVSDATATSTTSFKTGLPMVIDQPVPAISDRIAKLCNKVRTHRSVVDRALAAIADNKENTDSQYAIITGMVVEAVALFQDDPEATERLFLEAKVTCRPETLNPLHYCTAKYLMGNVRGGGPTSKVATVAASIGVVTSRETLERIALMGGFAKAYTKLRPKREAANEDERFVGAELIVRLGDGSEGIVPVSFEALVKLASKPNVVWHSANDNADLAGSDDAEEMV